MNEDNKIREQFQSRFSDFKSPLPDDGWARLEQSLAKASTAKIVRRRWYVGAAAAVLVLLLGSVLFLKNGVKETAPFISEAGAPTPSEQTVEKNQSLTSQPQEPLVAQQKTDVSSITGQTKKTSKKSAKSGTMPIVEKNKVLLGDILFRNSNKFVSNNEKDDAVAIQLFDESDKQRLMDDFIRAGERDELLLATAEPTKSNRKMMLSVSGRGGLTSFQRTVNSPMMLRSAVAPTESSNMLFSHSPMALANSNTANNIAEMEHSQPVSFGLMVSKPILNNLSIETGLVYTYLFSKARNINIASEIRETQQFHYLGIPLNVNYTLFSLKNLDLYLSVGAMAEKAVAGRRQYLAEASTGMNGSTEERITDKLKQDNLQYSVNAGVGLSYPVHDNLNIYGKVGGSYYFDAHNPHPTIYSDKKIMLDLNVGLRYEF